MNETIKKEEMKRFHVRTLLSVTTGRLLTKSKGPKDNGIGDMYELMGWMTGDAPFTHQLGRFGEECKPWLLRWFPELSRVDAYLTDLDVMLAEAREKKLGEEHAVSNWIAALGDVWEVIAQDEYDVPKMPTGYHEEKNPIQELSEMMGGKQVIVAMLDQAMRMSDDI